MRQISWSIIIIGATLLLGGCQQGAAALVAEDIAGPAPAAQPAVMALVSDPAISEPDAPQSAQVDECLECHADKERLIDTAKTEEGTAESESKGVG